MRRAYRIMLCFLLALFLLPSSLRLLLLWLYYFVVWRLGETKNHSCTIFSQILQNTRKTNWEPGTRIWEIRRTGTPELQLFQAGNRCQLHASYSLQISSWGPKKGGLSNRYTSQGGVCCSTTANEGSVDTREDTCVFYCPLVSIISKCL